MRICLIIDKLNTGGAQRQLILLANAFARLPDHEVQLICLQRLGPLASEVAADIRVISLDLDRIYGSKALRSITALAGRLKRERVDVIQTFLPSANIFGTLLGQLAKIPVVVSRRDVGLYPGKAWQLLEERLAFRLAARIVCVSQEVARLLTGKYLHLKEKTVCIPNAVDLEFADRYGLSVSAQQGDEEPYAVTVGRVEAIKGYDFLIDAMPEIPIKVKVVGGGSLLKEMKIRAMERGLAERIEFIGEKTPAETAVIMRNASFAVHPSYSEGMSNAILEYMVHHNAVVCRDIPSNRELVQEGITGYLFRDTEEFIKQTNRLASEKSLRLRMQENSLKFVTVNHSIFNVLKQLVNLYIKTTDVKGAAANVSAS